MPKITKPSKPLNIVCIGGGTQIPPLLLETLKKYPFHITGITSMVDCGGSAGQFRNKFNVLPPGDIRRHALALSNAPQWKKELWNFRFGEEVFEDGHKGHNFANAFISGLEISFKDYRKVIEYVSEFLETGANRALPAIIRQTHIIAELENGDIIKGEAEIDVPRNHDSHLKIKKVFLDPVVPVFPEAKKAVIDADWIIIGPGDLYSSIIPCLLPAGMQAALKKTKAKKILLCNSLAKMGETQNFSIMDFTKEIEKYLGINLDYVLYHNRPITPQMLSDLQKEYPQISSAIIVDSNLPKQKFIGKNLIKNDKLAFDPKKITLAVLNIIQN